jgi:hypothetical protein
MGTVEVPGPEPDPVQEKWASWIMTSTDESIITRESLEEMLEKVKEAARNPPPPLPQFLKLPPMPSYYLKACDCLDCNPATNFDDWYDRLPENPRVHETPEQVKDHYRQSRIEATSGGRVKMARDQWLDDELPPMEVGLWDGDKFEGYWDVPGDEDPPHVHTFTASYDRVAYQTYQKRPAKELEGLEGVTTEDEPATYSGLQRWTLPMPSWLTDPGNT